MGVCTSILKPSSDENNYRSLCTYPRKCTVNIKNINRSSSDQYDFHLTEPIHLKTDEVLIDSVNFIITQCILPGIDPRGQYFKKCQDNCLALFTQDSIFLGLFDGHGREGLKIVNLCCVICERYFQSHWSPASTSCTASSFLSSLCLFCDSELSNPHNNVDSLYSGT